MKKIILLFLAALTAFGQPTPPETGSLTVNKTTGAITAPVSAATFRSANGIGTGAGTVTSVSVTPANGVSGSVATSTTTPAISLTLGAITPSSVNSVVLSGASTPTLAVTGTATVSGANTGDQTTVSGNAGSATTVATTASSTNASFFPLFVASSSNGNQAANLATGLFFNPSTGLFTATGFSGTTGTFGGITHVAGAIGAANTLAFTSSAAGTGTQIITAPSGVASSGWNHRIFTGSFSGQDDPTMWIGYNGGAGTRVNAADSAVVLGFEADYYVDITARGAGLQHYQEAYKRFIGSGGNTLSAYTFTADKTNPLAFAISQFGIAGDNGFWSVVDSTSGSDVTMFKIGRTTSSFYNGYLNGFLGVGVTPSSSYRVYSAETAAGTQNSWRISQTATSGASNARLVMDTASGGGDPFINFAAGSTDWSVGIDNSVTNDPFKISRSGALGTTDVLTLTATDATFAQKIIANGGITISSTGTNADGIWSSTATLDFGSIATIASADLTITVTGASVGDSVALGRPAAPAAGIVFQGFVSAADTVTVRASNITLLSVDPASATYRATVTSF